MHPFPEIYGFPLSVLENTGLVSCNNSQLLCSTSNIVVHKLTTVTLYKMLDLWSVVNKSAEERNIFRLHRQFDFETGAQIICC